MAPLNNHIFLNVFIQIAQTMMTVTLYNFISAKQTQALFCFLSVVFLGADGGDDC